MLAFLVALLHLLPSKLLLALLAVLALPLRFLEGPVVGVTFFFATLDLDLPLLLSYASFSLCLLFLLLSFEARLGDFHRLIISDLLAVGFLLFSFEALLLGALVGLVLAVGRPLHLELVLFCVALLKVFLGEFSAEHLLDFDLLFLFHLFEGLELLLHCCGLSAALVWEDTD